MLRAGGEEIGTTNVLLQLVLSVIVKVKLPDGKLLKMVEDPGEEII